MKAVVSVVCFVLAVPAFVQQSQTPSDTAKPTILFQRTDHDSKKGSAPDGSDPTLKSEITDADRDAITFTRYALDVRLQPEMNGIAVRAGITVRNDSSQPIWQLPLQISSTLHWEEIRTAGQRSRFAVAKLPSDVDHTGELNEAAVLLPQPLAPGSNLDLDVIYRGSIPPSAARLQGIGTPSDIAGKTDWDEIIPDFIGLRGFGNVLWYPVSAVPVKLGDGDKLFVEIGKIKRRQEMARVSIDVTDEAQTSVPDVAILNGTVVPLTVAAGTEQAGVSSLVTCRLPSEALGFQTMSLFLAARHHSSGSAQPPIATIYAKTGEDSSVTAYLSAVEQAQPLTHTWLGERPRRQASLLSLPQIDDAPFESRATLYTALQPVAAGKLAEPVSHWLAHAYFHSPRPWLDEGVAQFVTGLAVEQTATREAALSQLDSQRGALALAEPSDGTVREDNSLLREPDAIFYRTKAAYVLWMLRSMIGDAALQAVLRTYDPSLDVTDDYFEKLVERIALDPAYAIRNQPPVAGAVQASARTMGKPDLHLFFEDWVYHDKGLPDLSILGVTPSKASTPNSYLVAVNVANNGGAGADVPITVTSGTTQVTERMLIPAHGTAVRRILIQDEPVQVQVNDGTVPEVAASEHQQRIHYAPAANP